MLPNNFFSSKIIWSNRQAHCNVTINAPIGHWIGRRHKKIPNWNIQSASCAHASFSHSHYFIVKAFLKPLIANLDEHFILTGNVGLSDLKVLLDRCIRSGYGGDPIPPNCSTGQRIPRLSLSVRWKKSPWKMIKTNLSESRVAYKTAIIICNGWIILTKLSDSVGRSNPSFEWRRCCYHLDFWNKEGIRWN